MSSAIQLLNNSLNQSAMLYRTVDEQLTKNLQVQQQAGQFDVQMKAKALAFAEEQRINNLRAEEMRATNDIRAKQFDLQKQLMPLKIEEANLQLESAKFAMTKQKDAFARQAFNDITAIYDESAAYSLIETQSPDQAKELLQHKAKWRGLVANGQPFVEQEYAKGIAEINSRYKDIRPEEGKVFDEKTHFLLGEISPKVQRVYELKNPVVAKNRNLIFSSYLDAPDNQVSEIYEKFGQLGTPEEWGIAGSTRLLYQTNKKRQSDNFSEYQKLMTAASTMGEGQEVEKQNMIKLANTYKEDAEKALKENMLIQSNFRGGKFVNVTEEEISAAQTSVAPKLPSIDPTKVSPPREISGAKVSTDPLQGEMMTKINELDRKLGGSEKNGPSPFLKGYSNGGILDLDWYNDRVTNVVDYKSLLSIKERIETNLDQVEDINTIVNEESVNSVLSSINTPKEIPISEYLKELLGARVSEYGNAEGSFLRFGRKQGKVEKFIAGPSLSSFDDINQLLSNVKNPAERKEARKEIYAAMAAAGLVNSIEK